MDTSSSPLRVLQFAASDGYGTCLPSEDERRRAATAPTVGTFGKGRDMALEGSEKRQQSKPLPPSPPFGKGLRRMDRKFQYKKVTNREIAEDKMIPWSTQGYVDENHRVMMEEDKEMTPWGTPRIRQLLSVMVVVIVNFWTS